VFLIAVASAFSSLTVMANATEGVVPLTLLFAFGLTFGFALSVWRLLIHFGLDERGATYGVGVFVLLVTNLGPLVDRYHRLDRIGLLLLSCVAGVLAYYLRNLKTFQLLLTWAALFLLAYPLVATVGRLGILDQPNLERPDPVALPEMATPPDVVIVVFDAYGSLPVLDEFYGYDNHPLLDTLAEHGFDAPGSVTPNYPRTRLSVPSVMEFDYVAEETPINDSDVGLLESTLRGRNRMVETLKVQGYRFVYVESGWLGTRCGSLVDVCVSASWPDESFYDVVARSILTGLPGFEIGRPFTEGGLRVSTWLKDDLPTYLNDDQPDIIFAHVLLPHPPLYLDSHCVPDWSRNERYSVGRPGMTDVERQEAGVDYIEQVECVNSTITAIAAALPDDDVMVMMGDHGPDGQAQFYQPTSSWTESQIRERFGAFLVTHVPGCDMSGIESLVNVGRRIMTCLGATGLPDLPTETYDLEKTPDGRFVRAVASNPG
jgi:hypothetical protein